MFNCGVCGKTSKAGERAVRVSMESRWVTYPPIKNAHHYWDRDGREIWKDDPGGEGAQIVKEVLSHKECAKNVVNTKELYAAEGI